MIAWLTGVALAVYSYKWHPKQRRAQLRSKMHEAPEKKKSINISNYYFLIKLFSVK